MKVSLALALTQVAFGSIGLSDDTIAGKLRVSIYTTDRATVVATQDIDDSNGNPVAVFEGVAAGTYIGVAQRLTGDDTQANLGSPFELSFAVDEVSPPAPKTFGQPSGLSVTVEADAAATA
jgi:hypothetical protein